MSDDARRLITSLAAEADDVELIAGVVPGARVRIRTRVGLVRAWHVATRGACGILILQPRDHRSLVVVDEPTIGQRERFLEALPAVRLIVVGERVGRAMTAVPFNVAEVRARFAQRFVAGDAARLVAVHGDVGARAFDVVVARFDGAHLWAYDVDRAQDPTVAEALRASTSESALAMPSGVTPEQRAAVAWAAAPAALRTEALRGSRTTKPAVPTTPPADTRDALRTAVARGGGEVRELVERDDVWWVTLRTARGVEHTVAVAKDAHHSVASAGICLSGRDRDFDLTSIVSVLDGD